jgi:hypothetical protein
MLRINPTSLGYIDRDWRTVLMKRVGRGSCSISVFITTASTSWV